MVKLTDQQITQLLARQRAFFASKTTYPLEFRISQLQKLKQVLTAAVAELSRALYMDLGRCEVEAGFDLGVINTIDYFIDNLPAWAEKKYFAASPMQAPATVYVEPIPLGTSLIISPWNYPIELTIAPLLGAISAGNTAIIKTSEYSPHCSRVLADIINNNFDSSYISVVVGGADIAQHLLEHQFAHIFYTGGTEVGRKVYQAASKYLTPVVLELGGKSPCIVDRDIDYKQAARRILFGKLINSGQTCVAPDYCLVAAEAYESLVTAFLEVLAEFYPNGALNSKDYSKIISLKHLQRLQQLLQAHNKDIIYGGEVDQEQQKISPCLLNIKYGSINTSTVIMNEEIFGPILPIICYHNPEEIYELVALNPQPLALYIFTADNDFATEVTGNIPSGGVCINDIMVHLFNNNCGFGGIGTSGLGSYHGELSFRTYSHYRTIAKRPLQVNDALDFRFPPYSVES